MLRTPRHDYNRSLISCAIREDDDKLDDRESELSDLCDAGDSLETYLQKHHNTRIAFALEVIDREIRAARTPKRSLEEVIEFQNLHEEMMASASGSLHIVNRKMEEAA